MKKLLFAVAVLTVSMCLVWGADAGPVGASATVQANGQGNSQEPGQAALAAQGADKDQPPPLVVVNPAMNAREKVEAQRAIYKRAAASRNALMQEAEKEKRNKQNPVAE
jgi:hypothetical protein